MLNTTSPGSSTPHYAQSTIESRPKDRNRQGTTSSGKVKGNSPDRKCPRLCEEDGIDVHDIEIKITANSERNRTYAAEDYGDTDADVWHRYNDTHSSRGIVPTPPTSTSGRTSQRGRQRRLLQPSTKAEFENRREKAQRNLGARREYFLKDEQEYIDQFRRLTEENKDLKKDHRKCETKLQEIYDMLNRLEKEKQNSNASKLNHEQEIKMLKNKHETELRKYASQRDRMAKEKQNITLKQLNNFKVSLESWREKLLSWRNKLESTNLDIKNALEKDLQRSNANVSKYKTDIEMYKKIAEERKTEINRLNHLVEDKEKQSREFESNYERTIKLLNKYKASTESTAEMEEQIREHQSKYEKMVKIIEQFKALNKESNEARYKMEHQLQRKIENLASVEETHRAYLEIRDEQKGVIRDLKNELSACEKNYEMLHQEYDELTDRLEESEMKNHSKEMSTHFDRIQNVEKEVSVLLMEKEIAVNKLQDADDTIQELHRNLEKRENRIRSLTEQLLRSEEKFSKLSEELKDARDDKKEVVEESLQRLQIQNENQKLVLVQATKKAEDLSKQSLSLQRYKDEAERITNNLCKDLNEHVKKNESLDKQVKQLLERNATVLRDKESAVIQINKLTNILHDKETEIQSLIGERSRNYNLLEHYSTLKKEKEILVKSKENAETRIAELTRTLHGTERKIESLTKDLTRLAATSEETEKTLRKDVSSYRSAYDKMARENGDLSEQCSTLQKEKASLLKDKEDAEQQIKELKRTSQSMERKIESLTNELTSHIMKVTFDRAALRRKHRLFVASIDFGTTYSGYAFSSKDEWKKNPLKIHTNVWNSGTKTSAKTPTALLLGPNREFLSFGYDAETKYSESEGNFASYYYFHCFKLKLQDTDNLNWDTLIGDATGKNLDAITVFSTSIEYITDHLFKSLSDNFPEIEKDDIHFVLTVPAIWNDIAKRFMAEAAVRAGIPTEQLSIAMEQETAAIYCREDYLSQDQDRASNLKEGMNFMVVDLGGGTTDITFHKSLDNGKFEEIRQPTGGLWGGQNVNEAFFDFIAELFGQSVIDQLKKMHMDDYLELERRFEIRKRSISSNKTGSVKINFPLIVFQLANKMNKTESVCDIIAKNAKYAGKIKTEAQKLQIPTEILISLFRPTIGKIIEHIHTILKENTNEVDVILMVGGFAECDIVQNEFKKNFSDKKIIVPEEAGLAVMKGAVLYGHMQ